MVKYGIAISEEELGPSAPVLIQGGLLAAIEKAAQWGFSSVEIHIRNPQSLDPEHLAAAAERWGVEISAVGTGLEHTLNGLNLTSPDDTLRQRTMDRYKEHIDLAGNFGATVFVGLCRGSTANGQSVENHLQRLETCLQELGPYAAQRGASLSLEPIARYMTDLLNSTEETLEFLSRPGLESIMLLMDTHHMFYEDGDIHDTLVMCEGRIDHVHISDSDRLYPGSGEVDYNAVGESLKDIGYEKAISLEVLPLPDSRTAAQKGLEWMQHTWG